MEKTDYIKTDISGKWVPTEFVVSVMETLRELEQKLADANKRIAELEKKYEQELLE
jgi:hypothetical protein